MGRKKWEQKDRLAEWQTGRIIEWQTGRTTHWHRDRLAERQMDDKKIIKTEEGEEQ
jgi:hypothetical protein